MPCLVLREKLKFSVAGAAAGIGEALPLFGNKLPVVGTRLEGELQYAKGRGIAQFAVGLRRAERAGSLAAGANDEFANAALGIGGPPSRVRGAARSTNAGAPCAHTGGAVAKSRPGRPHASGSACRS